MASQFFFEQFDEAIISKMRDDRRYAAVARDGARGQRQNFFPIGEYLWPEEYQACTVPAGLSRSARRMGGGSYRLRAGIFPRPAMNLSANGWTVETAGLFTLNPQSYR